MAKEMEFLIPAVTFWFNAVKAKLSTELEDLRMDHHLSVEGEGILFQVNSFVQVVDRVRREHINIRTGLVFGDEAGKAAPTPPAMAPPEPEAVHAQ